MQNAEGQKNDKITNRFYTLLYANKMLEPNKKMPPMGAKEVKIVRVSHFKNVIKDKYI